VRIYKKMILLALILLYSANAMAYLDPGTGSVIIQGVIAGLAIVILEIKNIYRYIKSFLKQLSNKLKKVK